MPALAVPFEPAVVGDIAFAVGAERGAIRPAAGPRHDAFRPIRGNPGQRATGDLDEQD